MSFSSRRSLVVHAINFSTLTSSASFDERTQNEMFRFGFQLNDGAIGDNALDGL